MILWDENFTKVEDIRDAFNHTWTKKFLDFTVFKFREKTQLSIYFYNPFHNILKRRYDKRVKIFPDKLNDQTNEAVVQNVESEYSLTSYIVWSRLI